MVVAVVVSELAGVDVLVELEGLLFADPRVLGDEVAADVVRSSGKVNTIPSPN